MPRFVIERGIPERGTAEREQLREAFAKSNSVLEEMRTERKNIQWEHSYVVQGKTFCIYLEHSEDLFTSTPREAVFPLPK